MKNETLSRRDILKASCFTAGTLLAAAPAARAADSALHLASNQYSWHVYFQREGRDFIKDLDAGFKEAASSGIDGFEPSIGDPGQIDSMAPQLKKHGLEMRSLYVNSTLHTAEDAKKSIEQILAVAAKAKAAGARIIVTNPNPLQWGGTENKNDEQLHIQADALDRLGESLAQMGMTLAYHNHDMELRNAAREFHHMMAGTNPKHVTLCLDAHWIYRGSGNSQVALFDVVELYGARISELHLRQSINNIWSETFAEGDIDYARLAKALRQIGVKPHLVLEQAAEKGTPQTMNPVEVHKKSAAYVRQLFSGF
ncbi:MAG: TIM barrel protein [Candidatus Omnitrophota bacterium]